MPRMVLFGVLLCCVAVFASPQEFLVRLDTADARGFKIVELIDDAAIIIASVEDRLTLENFSIAYTVLDNDPRDKFYLFVFPFGEDIRKIDRCGTVIASFSECLLLRTTPEFVPVLNTLKVELSILKFRPVRTNSGFYSDAREMSFAPDTLIQKMVAAVNPDTVLAAVLYMQRLYTRYSTSDSNRVVLVNWIRDKLAAYDCDSIYTQSFSAAYGQNIIGIEKGKLYQGVRRYCLIGGHVDDIPSSAYAPGADDNASGTAAVLEAARVMRNFNFENTIRFAGFNAEEQGLIGSDSLAAFALSQGDTILAAICYDMIGYVSEPDSDKMRLRYTTAVPGCSVFACAYYQAVADTYTQLKINHVRYIGTSGSSDHASFWKYGYIATGGIERALCPGYHTIGDSVGPVGFNNLAFAVQVIKTAIAVLAKIAVPIHAGSSMSEYVAENTAPIFHVYPSVGSNFTVHFQIEEEGNIDLCLYDVTGRRVAQLAHGRYDKGVYTAKWSNSAKSRLSNASGIYFIAFNTENKVIRKKVVFVK